MSGESKRRRHRRRVIIRVVRESLFREAPCGGAAVKVPLNGGGDDDDDVDFDDGGRQKRCSQTVGIRIGGTAVESLFLSQSYESFVLTIAH